LTETEIFKIRWLASTICQEFASRYTKSVSGAGADDFNAISLLAHFFLFYSLPKKDKVS
jgi:hypothetical protein